MRSAQKQSPGQMLCASGVVKWYALPHTASQ